MSAPPPTLISETPQENTSIFYLLGCLWSKLNPVQRRAVCCLFLLSCICGIFELGMLGVAAPFLSMLTGKSWNEANFLGKWFPSLTESRNTLAITFLLVSISAATARIVLLYFTNRVGFRMGADLGLLVYKQALLQPLEAQKSHSSAEIISAASEKSHTIAYDVVVAVLQFTGAGIVFLSIVTALFIFNKWVTLGTVAYFSGVYLLVVYAFRGKIQRAGQEVASLQTKVLRALQEGLGSKRDVILHKAQAYYCDLYSEAIIPLRKAQGRIQFAIQGPRFIIESAVVLAIGGIFIILENFSGDVSSMLPLLGVFALGGLKMLPITQQLYAASTAIISSRNLMHDVLVKSAQNSKSKNDAIHHTSVSPLNFEQEIELHELNFTYAGATIPVIRNVSLTIKRGDRIAVIGPSGGGKSTFADLLLGLLIPSGGELRVDGTPITASTLDQWHALVAHVPQDIYIADVSIAENIAVATPAAEIDMERVKQAAEFAKLRDFIEHLPETYKSSVGEGGNKLSGGQRQRIGIARALYRGAKFLVLDEATSALDRDLERELLAAIHDLPRDITVIMVTHNLENTSQFDRTFQVKDGGVLVS